MSEAKPLPQSLTDSEQRALKQTLAGDAQSGYCMVLAKALERVMASRGEIEAGILEDIASKVGCECSSAAPVECALCSLAAHLRAKAAAARGGK